VAAASLPALDLVDSRPELRERLFANTERFRERMTAAGFDVLPGTHPIVPVMYGDAARAVAVAAGQARIRVQLSAAHTPDDVDQRSTPSSAPTKN
jgi:glycine C-acetyltransferase